MLEDQMEENLFSNNCKQITREQFEMHNNCYFLNLII